MTDWVAPVVTAVLGLIGLYLANSIRRRFRQDIQARVADKRFEAYATLWAETKLAAGMRKLTGEGGLSREERNQLADRLTTWYYARGNGILLSEDTRKIFLEAKHNLIRCVGDLTPALLKERAQRSSDPDKERGMASLSQISLLRASMRADLAIYSKPANPTGRGTESEEEDLQFLFASKVNPKKRPWRPALRERLAGSLRRRAQPVGQEPRQLDA